jgi:hypothetical protein
VTISDGMIGAVTKIVDHGPNADRWNVVILGDGYQSAELGRYQLDVSNFVQHFSRVAPFDQLWGKINIHQVDVTSTDSFADDPAYCSDGTMAQPVTGLATATYFDSTFCADGDQRSLLSGDHATALAASLSAVPGANLARLTLVIVNAQYAGSGGGSQTDQVVFFSNNSSSFAEVAMHEIGHTAFKLADEYESSGNLWTLWPLGVGQAPNITTNTNPATTEWRDLILPGTPLPTMRNPTPGVVNPINSPVPPGTVGLFEGAAGRYQGVYRSEYDCIMRHWDSGAPFCKVCQRQIRAVLAPFGGTMSWETNGNQSTNPPTDFLGTTDNKPVVIKVNGQEQVQVTNSEVKFKSGINLGGELKLFHSSSVVPLGKIWTARNPTQSLNLNAGGKDPSITIDTKGFVGIGTDRPDSRLEVNGGNLLMQAPATAKGQAGEILFRGPTGGSFKARIWSEPSAATGLHMSSGANKPNLTIDENGNVGIGTTDPGAKLEIRAGDLLLKAAVPGAVVFQNAAGVPKGRIWTENPAGTGLHLSSGDLTPDITIDPDGNVGIGTTQPTSKLLVRGGQAGGVTVSASNTADGAALLAVSTSTQLATLVAMNSGAASAIQGHAFQTSTTSFGVLGLAGPLADSPVTAFDGGFGVLGYSPSGTGVGGMTDGLGVACNGVEGLHVHGSGAGVLGVSDSPAGVGVHGANRGGGYAGYFVGSVGITGTISVGGGKQFKIDHPLAPAEKFLIHSSVESPDMMNVYNGNITTDADCQAVVELPAYFEALNRDFRYQLTVIGKLALVAVAREIKGNRFVIQSDRPKVKVSWQVTGVRKDAYAKAHPMKVEQAKSAKERGRYLHPELYPVVSDKPDAKLPIGSLASMLATKEKSTSKRKPKPKAKAGKKKSAA